MAAYSDYENARQYLNRIYTIWNDNLQKLKEKDANKKLFGDVLSYVWLVFTANPNGAVDDQKRIDRSFNQSKKTFLKVCSDQMNLIIPEIISGINGLCVMVVADPKKYKFIIKLRSAIYKELKNGLNNRSLNSQFRTVLNESYKQEDLHLNGEYDAYQDYYKNFKLQLDSRFQEIFMIALQEARRSTPNELRSESNAVKTSKLAIELMYKKFYHLLFYVTLHIMDDVNNMFGELFDRTILKDLGDKRMTFREPISKQVNPLPPMRPHNWNNPNNSESYPDVCRVDSDPEEELPSWIINEANKIF